ncbi:patatin-like phospholipase family protein [Halalkalibacter urbisdiaboli]|uniref:patatin-like phospholipase family protein n=1 Tax=Halalkalibacter urbisdiaboli TaxID=1960589 RepID=UPI000B43ECDF|nr:patatin-like phospholipase family protein [Halalkalibacter urbisdiaboli]
MKIDGVFAGGGVKAFSFIGAYQIIEEQGYEFERLGGTSAGSIIAALIKAGYKSHEIYNLLDKLNVEEFKDERISFLPFSLAKWVHLYFKLGLFKGDKLEEWLRDVLKAKGISTFGDLPKNSLRIVASDLSRGRMIVLPDDLEQYGAIPEKFSVARAVRMSCSIPYFFEPVKLYHRSGFGKYSYVVDGGILSNFPMWLFRDGKVKAYQRPVIGFQLTPQLKEVPSRRIKNAVVMFKALFETMSSAHDVRYIEKEHAKNIVFIPILDVKSTDFSLSEEMKEKLVTIGREETKHFLKNWS